MAAKNPILVCLRCGGQVMRMLDDNVCSCANCAQPLADIVNDGVVLRTDHAYDLAPLLNAGKIVAGRNGTQVVYEWHNAPARLYSARTHAEPPDPETLDVETTPGEDVQWLKAAEDAIQRMLTRVGVLSFETVRGGGRVGFHVCHAAATANADAARAQRTPVASGDVRAIITLHTHAVSSQSAPVLWRKIAKCPRCGGRHDEIAFWNYGTPVRFDSVRATHYAYCPQTCAPIQLTGEPNAKIF